MPGDTTKPWLEQYPDSWPEDIDYPEISVPELLQRRAEEYADNTALVFQGRELTYSDLLGAVQRTAAGLQELGVSQGDHVSICMPNVPQFTFSFYGVQWLGGVTVHTSHLYSERELNQILRRTDATTMIVLDECLPEVDAVIDDTSVETVVVTSFAEFVSPDIEDFVSPSNADIVDRRGWHWFDDVTDTAADPPDIAADIDDTASMLHTGGTTGFPKSVPVTHRYWVMTSAQGELIDLAAYEDEGIDRGRHTMTGLMPMFHLNGNWTANLYAVYNGGSVVMYSDFQPELVLRDIEQHGITHMHVVPTMLTALLNHPKRENTDFSSLEHLAVASAPVPQSKKDQIEEITGATIFELYGQTETAFTTAEPLTNRREGSCGIPVSSVQIDVVDVDTHESLPPGEVGEFVAKVADHTMSGYYKNQEETDRTIIDGWIHTDDMGYRDEDWFFYHVDRRDDMIITSGHNVYPAEVEEVLHGSPRVGEVAVIGTPDDFRGERVTAFIELEDEVDMSIGDLEVELTSFCEEQLAEYKVPQEFRFRDRLPRTDVGKISRSTLEDEFDTNDEAV